MMNGNIGKRESAIEESFVLGTLTIGSALMIFHCRLSLAVCR